MATYCVLRHFSRRNVLPSYLRENALPSSVPSWVQVTPSLERDFHTSTRCPVNHTKEKAIVKHLNYIDHEKSLKHAQSPLVALPDYTYQDGRPTELTVCYKRRQEKNYGLAKQVVKLVDEVRFAQNQLASQEEADMKREADRRKAQLKHKGKRL